MAELVRCTESGMPPKIDKNHPSGRINVVASMALLQRLDEWRSIQRPIPTKSEAARLLMEMGLDAAEKDPTARPASHRSDEEDGSGSE